MRVFWFALLMIGTMLVATAQGGNDKTNQMKRDGTWAIVAREQDGVKIDEAVKKDQALLKGTWTLTSFETEQGKKDEVPSTTIIFTDDRIVQFVKEGETSKGNFTIDPAAKPKALTFTMELQGKDVTLLAIYRVDKDHLTICFADSPKGGRPKEFVGENRQTVLSLKRIK
jgi:uncharacterized protein (TIGR03067 family)